MATLEGRLEQIHADLDGIHADIRSLREDRARREGAARLINWLLVVIAALIPIVGGATVWAMRGVLVSELSEHGLLGLSAKVAALEQARSGTDRR